MNSMSIGAHYATREQWGNRSRKNEESEPSEHKAQLRMWLVMEVTSDSVKNIIA